jgi:hypothetical protein
VALAAPLMISAGVLAPAQAAPISAGSVLNLSNVNNNQLVKVVTPTPGLDFIVGNGGNQRVRVGSSTGTFNVVTTANSTVALIKDITFNTAPTSYIGTLTDFLSNIRIGPAGSITTISFDLTKLVYDATTGDAAIQGIFRSGADTIDAIGTFTSSLPASPSTYQISLTAVPTPAVLPALLGFGISLVRKRKASELAEA